MTLIVPNEGEVATLQDILNRTLTMKLFSNNIVPAEGDTAASYIEVVGGGYANKTLTYASWTIVAGAPSYGLYNTAQDFNFTGPTNAPGTVYGYFIVDSNNKVRAVERFAAGVLPFSPVLNSLIRIRPRIEAS